MMHAKRHVQQGYRKRTGAGSVSESLSSKKAASFEPGHSIIIVIICCSVVSPEIR